MTRGFILYVCMLFLFVGTVAQPVVLKAVPQRIEPRQKQPVGKFILRTRVSIKLENATLEQVINEIKKQTNWQFGYSLPDIIHVRIISINVKNITVRELFDEILQGKGLDVTYYEDFIVLKPGKRTVIPLPPKPLTQYVGYVIDEDGAPIPGCYVTVTGKQAGIFTNEKGWFRIQQEGFLLEVRVSGEKYHERSVLLIKGDTALITLKENDKPLDEVVVIAYGSAIKKSNVGSVDKIRGNDLSPVRPDNAFASISDWAPGVSGVPLNGLYRTAVRLSVRGFNPRIGEDQGPSELPANDPLIIVDGIPFITRSKWSSKLTGPGFMPDGSGVMAGGFSLFGLMNNLDIESIEVLKDASATAIYGSLAAHGAMLITTKKGKNGKPRLTLNYNTGWYRASTLPSMMGTAHYLPMRHTMQGNTQDPAKFPELYWDTTRSIDLPRLLMGETARMNSVHMQLNGGDNRLNYNMGIGGRKSSSIFPANMPSSQVTTQIGFQANPAPKWKIGASIVGGTSTDIMPATDITPYFRLPPNTPEPYDKNGQMQWKKNNVAFVNPWAKLLQTYTVTMASVLASGQVAYEMPQTTWRLSYGLHNARVEEVAIFPEKANDPAQAKLGAANFANTRFSSIILEPQLEYRIANNERRYKINLLLGATYLDQKERAEMIIASDYPKNTPLTTPATAGKIKPEQGGTNYRYAAGFSRIHGEWRGKYVAELTTRVDGIGRIGAKPKAYGYGAVGLVWLFGEEKFLRSPNSWITNGRLRTSYGTSGNHPALYKTIGVWRPGSQDNYGGTGTLQPDGLADFYPKPELNRKKEVAIELELWDRLSLVGAYYSNVTSRQVVSTTVAAQSGLGVVRGNNAEAGVENAGTEFTINYTSKVEKNRRFSTQLVLSGYRNKLKYFKGLDSSLYSSSLIVGQPLTVQQGAGFGGVDPATGVFQYVDRNGDGVIGDEDNVVAGSLTPSFFAAWTGNIKRDWFELDFCIDACTQQGIDPELYMAYINNTPGKWQKSLQMNLPAAFANRWRQPGDVSKFQRVGNTPDLQQGVENVKKSRALLANMSYYRLKYIRATISPFGLKTLNKWGVSSCRFYIEGQNLWQNSKGYKGDPTIVQSYSGIPSMRGVVLGFETKL